MIKLSKQIPSAPGTKWAPPISLTLKSAQRQALSSPAPSHQLFQRLLEPCAGTWPRPALQSLNLLEPLVLNNEARGSESQGDQAPTSFRPYPHSGPRPLTMAPLGPALLWLQWVWGSFFLAPHCLHPSGARPISLGNFFLGLTILDPCSSTILAPSGLPRAVLFGPLTLHQPRVDSLVLYPLAALRSSFQRPQSPGCPNIRASPCGLPPHSHQPLSDFPHAVTALQAPRVILPAAPHVHAWLSVTQGQAEVWPGPGRK